MYCPGNHHPCVDCLAMRTDIAPNGAEGRLMLTDFTGREIRPASQVAYAVRRGAKQWLCKATVTEVGHDYLTVQRTMPPSDRLLTLRQMGTVAVLGGVI